jgi:hypothetical protein
MEELNWAGAKEDRWMQQADDCFVNESFQAPQQVTKKASNLRSESVESLGNRHMAKKSITQIEQTERDTWAEEPE